MQSDESQLAISSNNISFASDLLPALLKLAGKLTGSLQAIEYLQGGNDCIAVSLANKLAHIIETIKGAW